MVYGLSWIEKLFNLLDKLVKKHQAILEKKDKKTF